MNARVIFDMAGQMPRLASIAGPLCVPTPDPEPTPIANFWISDTNPIDDLRAVRARHVEMLKTAPAWERLHIEAVIRMVDGMLRKVDGGSG